jgi:hypothetical protein
VFFYNSLANGQPDARTLNFITINQPIKDSKDTICMTRLETDSIVRNPNFQETIPGQLNLKAAYNGIGLDLAKVSFGLAVSVALVYIMRFLLTGSLSAPI